MASVYDYLFKDKDYMEKLSQYQNLVKEMDRVKKMELEPKVLKVYANKIATQLQEEYIEGRRATLEALQEEKRRIRLEHEGAKYDDPQQEILRRSDLEAKINNMSQDDLKDYIRDLRAEDINVYDYNLIKSKLTDDSGVNMHMNNLKHELSVNENPKYKELEERETAFYQLHGGFNGQDIRKSLFIPDGDTMAHTDIVQSIRDKAKDIEKSQKSVNYTNTAQFMKGKEITDEEVQVVGY